MKRLLPVFAALMSFTVQAQSIASAPVEFDAASVRPFPTPGGGGILQYTPGRVAGRLSATRLIMEAYHMTYYQISGGPDWPISEMFDIEGKAAAPAGETQLRQMLQALLAQRFKLAVRHETKDIPVYALTVARGGPRLREIKPGDPIPTRTPPDPGMVRVFFVETIHDFVESLNKGDTAGRPVLDQTGLLGTFVIDFQAHSSADFLDSVQEQSGLRFEPRKAPLDTIVIEHIEKPDAN